MRKRGQTKGIFCIEGLWDPDLRLSSTVRPLMELLRLNESIDYIHREYATREEFEFYLSKWTQKSYDAYPILYVAGHGKEGGIEMGSGVYSIDAMADLLASKCANRLIMFSSCSTMNISKQKLQLVLDKTGALAVCGYRVDVDWLRSTAFELLLLARMQDNEFSGRGIEAILHQAEEIAKSFGDLEFRMVTIKDVK
ncbi:MAG: hypothetical protein JSW03_04045 [Candidatus Eiseniibacteriota bacterium]|nr:MAG: hypothetical protein JSW03_04045 [Candidatus Eisenbacteria bacterium]